MKKNIILLIFSCLLMPNAWAYFEYEYLRCTPIDGTNNVSVVYNTDTPTKGKSHTSTTLIIPDVVSDGINTYTVTEIGYQGFRNITNITQINLPNTLTKIGYKAFAQCNQLGNNEDYPGKNPDYFNQGSITIPASVTHIGARAFYNHSQNLKHVFIESSTPPIFFNDQGSTDALNIDDVFYIHTLVKFHIPGGSLNNYKNNAQWAGGDFEDPDNIDKSYFDVGGLRFRIIESENVSVEVINILESTNIVSIPNTVVSSKDHTTYKVTKIADGAFRNTSAGNSVKNIIFESPSNITTIGKQAFTNNKNFVGNAGTFTIPASVNTIGYHAFYGCNGIKKIIFEGEAPTLLQSNGISGESALETFNHVNNSTKNPIPCQFTCGKIEPNEWDIPILHDCPIPTISQKANGVISGLPKEDQKYFGKITYKRIFTPGIWETLYLPFKLEDMTITVDTVGGGEPVTFSVNFPWRPDKGGYFHLAVRNGEYFDYVQNGDTLQGHTAYIIQFPSQAFSGVTVTFTSKSDYNKVSEFTQQSATTNHNMYGNTTLQNQTLSGAAYYLGNDNNFKYTESYTLKPFECYLTPIIETQVKINPRMMAVRMRPQNDVSTDIPSVNGEQLSWQRNGNTLIIEAKGQPVSIYNINGALIQSFAEGQEQITMELTSGCYIINSAGTAQKIIF